MISKRTQYTISFYEKMRDEDLMAVIDNIDATFGQQGAEFMSEDAIKNLQGCYDNAYAVAQKRGLIED